MNEPRFYSEEPKRSLGTFLDDDVYMRAVESLIIVCTDFVPVDRARRVIYLSKRIVHSARGVWRFGGRQRAGETIHDSCTRIAKRELGLLIPPKRFMYLTTAEDLWAWRKQEPQNTGAHNLTHIFSIECTPNELALASIHLDPSEYDTSFGIQEFDRARLVAENVRPQIIDMYDALFPSSL